MPESREHPADSVISLKAPAGFRETWFHSSHSAKCHDLDCLSRNHASPRTRLLRVLEPPDQPSLESPSDSTWVDDPANARRDLIQRAYAWTSRYRPSPVSLDDWLAAHQSGRPLLLSGHQPELFHPGVWYKNFLLAEASRLVQGVGINLLVDQDLVKTNAILVPVDHGDRTGVTRVSVDYGGVGLPHEERAIGQPSVWQSFPARVREVAVPWVSTDWMETLWPIITKRHEQLGKLGYAISAARHEVEMDHGAKNLEVPLSSICETIHFAQFIFRILDRLEVFAQGYNQVLREYRLGYHIKGNQRPMPDLAKLGDWHELPFWVWSARQPWRQRLWVRRIATGWELGSSLGEGQPTDAWRLSLARRDATEVLAQLPQTEIRLRPRALMTTLYSRGVLSQSFLHGLGGGLYDQMTDRLARLVWGVTLPNYLLATGTFPLVHIPERLTPEAHRSLQQRLRVLQYAPERDSSFAAAHPDWIAEKWALLDRQPPSGQRRDWQAAFNAHLDIARQWLAAEIEETRQRLGRWEAEFSTQKWQSYREWSFVLYASDLPQTLAESARREFAS